MTVHSDKRSKKSHPPPSYEPEKGTCGHRKGTLVPRGGGGGGSTPPSAIVFSRIQSHISMGVGIRIINIKIIIIMYIIASLADKHGMLQLRRYRHPHPHPHPHPPSPHLCTPTKHPNLYNCDPECYFFLAATERGYKLCCQSWETLTSHSCLIR